MSLHSSKMSDIADLLCMALAARLTVRIDPGWLFVIAGLAICVAAVLVPAQRDLHELRWEMLRGADDSVLSSTKDILFSRYLPSGREVALRPERDDLRALIVVVSPSDEDQKKYNLSEINTDIDGRAAGLAPIPCDSLTSDDGPVTMNKLIAITNLY